MTVEEAVASILGRQSRRNASRRSRARRAQARGLARDIASSALDGLQAGRRSQPGMSRFRRRPLAQVMRALRRAFDEQVTTTGATPAGQLSHCHRANPATTSMTSSGCGSTPVSPRRRRPRRPQDAFSSSTTTCRSASCSRRCSPMPAMTSWTSAARRRPVRARARHDRPPAQRREHAGGDGARLIRFALSEHPDTATLLISALEDPGIAQVAMQFGAYGYLSKPVRRTAA